MRAALPAATMPAAQRYTRGELIADRCVHILGMCAAVGACAVLLAPGQRPDDITARAALGLYAFGLITMLGCSALYHLAREGHAKALLRRFDHAAIFVMIAGTYTPVTALALPGMWGGALLAAIWAGAIAGAALKILTPSRFERLSIVAYLLLGWAGVMMFRPLADAVPARDIVLLAAGGGLYTLGVVAHLSTSVRYHNALWHAFVVIAAGCHFAAIYNIAAAPAG